MDKPKLWHYLLAGCGAAILTIGFLVGFSLFTKEQTLVVSKVMSVSAGFFIVYNTFAFLFWLIRRDTYKEYITERSNTFILTYLMLNGKEKVSEVFPQGMYTAFLPDGTPECRLVFDFYDQLNDQGHPQSRYITTTQFIKLEYKHHV